jgi:hypothetical protein
MKPLFIIVVWFVFVAINILVAESNDATRRRRIANKNTKQIEHFWYALGYCILCGIPFYISRNWWELGSLLLLHISIFPCAYNFFSDNNLFHLSPTSEALTDRTMRQLGLKSTEEVNIIAFCISIIFLFIQIFFR